MCPTATYEEGSEIVLDSEIIAPGATWTDEATAGSEVFRIGSKVTLALRVTPKARAAWEKKVYKLGELATEGGHTYEAKVAETDENKPSTKAAHWTDLGLSALTTVICTLPPEYRPGAVIKDATTATVEVKVNGEVVALDALTAGTAKVYTLTYRAAGVSP